MGMGVYPEASGEYPMRANHAADPAPSGTQPRSGAVSRCARLNAPGKLFLGTRAALAYNLTRFFDPRRSCSAIHRLQVQGTP